MADDSCVDRVWFFLFLSPLCLALFSPSSFIKCPSLSILPHFHPHLRLHRKVRCDGLSRCANCTRVKRECLYLPVDDATNQATKERKSHLKNLKALGYIVPRGGAAIKAVKAGKLAAANLLNITAPCKAPPVLNLAFLPPPPTKRVNTASQEVSRVNQ